jgi:hypothetical protein
MPTGYTCIIDDNPDVTFEEFAWRCARAFGALVLMRDDPIDAAVPDEVQPDPYYRNAVADAERALHAAEVMTLADAERAMAAEAGEREKYNREQREKHAKLRAGYDRMKVAAAAWNPPTKDHEGMRKFMLEQLETGDPGECYQQVSECVTAEGWLTDKRAAARESLEYRRKSLREEEERVRNRNAWVAALRSSIPQPVKP